MVFIEAGVVSVQRFHSVSLSEAPYLCLVRTIIPRQIEMWWVLDYPLSLLSKTTLLKGLVLAVDRESPCREAREE